MTQAIVNKWIRSATWALGCAVVSCVSTEDGLALRKVRPPATADVQRVIRHEGFAWDSLSTEHFEIYYERDSFAAGKLPFLRDAAEEAVQRAVSVLGEAGYERGMRLFVLSSRDRMFQLIGRRYKGYTMLTHQAVFVVFNDDTRPYLRHEVMHAVSFKLWGRPPTWLAEGSAVYADGTCLDYEDPFHTIAAHMMRDNRLFAMERLVNRFNQCAAEGDIAAYVQAGSFFQFLYERYGVSKIRALWQSTDVPIAGILGASLPQLERDWHNHLREKTADTHPVDWNEVVERSCG